MDAAQQTLDIARFAKVVAMARGPTHDGRDNAHERDNALNKARKLAENAGLTLDEALRRLDEQTKPKSWADEFYEARKREEAAAEERRKSPAFAEHPLEAEIRTVLAREGIDLDNFPAGRISFEQRSVIREAIPFPANLRGVIDELRVWDEIEDSRRRLEANYRLALGAQIRRDWLVDALTNERASTVADAMARVTWGCALNLSSAPAHRQIDNALLLYVVRRDMAQMEKMIRNAVEAGRASNPPPKRTREAARAAVLRILREPEGMSLSLRVVAARAGVSPQTVSTIKATFNLSNLDNHKNSMAGHR